LIFHINQSEKKCI